MIRLAPDYMEAEGTAAEWFQENHGAGALTHTLSTLFSNYSLEAQYNSDAARLVLEAMILSALLSHPERKIHKDLGLVIKGGVSPRNPQCLSIVQIEVTDQIGGDRLASMSFTFNESTEEWNAFDLTEVI